MGGHQVSSEEGDPSITTKVKQELIEEKDNEGQSIYKVVSNTGEEPEGGTGPCPGNGTTSDAPGKPAADVDSNERKKLKEKQMKRIKYLKWKEKWLKEEAELDKKKKKRLIRDKRKRLEEPEEAEEEPEKENSVAKSCFICSSLVIFEENPFSSEIDLEEIPNHFNYVLRHLLHLTEAEVQKHCKKFGEFEEWLDLCTSCLLMGKSVAVQKKKVILLQQEIKKNQEEITKKLKTTLAAAGVKEVGYINENAKRGRGRPRSKQKKTGESEDALTSLRNLVSARISIQNKAEETPVPGSGTRRTRILLKTEPIEVPPPPEEDNTLHVPMDTETDAVIPTEKNPSSIGRIEVNNEIFEMCEIFVCGSCEDAEDEFASEAELQKHREEVHLRRNQNGGEDDTAMDCFDDWAGTGLSDVEVDVNENSENEPATITREDEVEETGGDGESNEIGVDEGAPVRKEKKGRPYALLEPYCYQLYSCPVCPDVKNYYVNRYIQHLSMHRRRPLKCTECPDLFVENDSSILERHWALNHQEKGPFSLDNFPKVESNPGEIWKCFGCSTGFLKEEDRDAHEASCKRAKRKNKFKRLNNEKIPCLHCPTSKTFRNRAEWRLHRATVHPEIDSMCCFYCDESFKEELPADSGQFLRNDLKLEEHMNTFHKKRGQDGKHYLECQLCGEVFLSANYRFHVKIKAHAEEKHNLSKTEAFQCHLCPKRFYDYQKLSRHLILHFGGTVTVHREKNSTGIRQSGTFSCEICGSIFNSMDRFFHHQFKKHGIEPDPDSGFKVQRCPHPGCQFQSVLGFVFNHHVNTVHASHRAHQCDECGKAFTTKSSLNKHKLSHENNGKQNFLCEICSTTFGLYDAYRDHLRMKHHISLPRRERAKNRE